MNGDRNRGGALVAMAAAMIAWGAIGSIAFCPGSAWLAPAQPAIPASTGP